MKKGTKENKKQLPTVVYSMITKGIARRLLLIRKIKRILFQLHEHQKQRILQGVQTDNELPSLNNSPAPEQGRWEEPTPVSPD